MPPRLPLPRRLPGPIPACPAARGRSNDRLRPSVIVIPIRLSSTIGACARKTAPTTSPGRFAGTHKGHASWRQPTPKRCFSTAPRRHDLELEPSTPNNPIPPAAAPTTEVAPQKTAIVLENETVDKLPALTRADTLDGRYPALVEQFVGLIQQNGKKGIAQKNVALILHHLRTSPPPRLAKNVPLLLGALPASQLPLHPLQYLGLAVDSLAPLVRLRVERNQAGGGAGVVVPRPLRVRQRRRMAIVWIRDAADKRNMRQLGRKTRAHLIAQEIIAVVEGKSKLWEKRAALHKVAMTNRQHVGFVRRNIKKKLVFL